MFLRLCSIPVQIFLGRRLQLRNTVVLKHVACWHLNCWWLHSSGSQLQNHDQGVKQPVMEPADSETKRLHIDSKKIKQVQQHLERQGIEVTEAKLEENWRFLKSYGCLDDHVYCFPKILSLSEYELAEQIGRLYELGCKEISVGLLRLAKRHTTKKLLQQKVEAYMENGFSQSATVMDVIGCDQDELEILVQKIPKVMEVMTSNPKILGEKVDLLLQNGYSVQDIVWKPGVLAFSRQRIRDRLEQINQMEGLDQKPHLSTMIHSKFEEYLQRLADSGHLFLLNPSAILSA